MNFNPRIFQCIKKHFIVFISVFYSKIIFGQLLLNNGAIINLNGGVNSSSSVYLTLNTPPVNPIIMNGSGTSGIKMETEYSVTQYNLGTKTTAITIPFVSSFNEYFPLMITPVSAGVGTGSLLFSSQKAATRSTGWDNSSYMPSDVNNMNSPTVTDNSASVIDRFWIIDVKNYTSTPAVNLSFSYINAEGASNGGNTLNLSNIQAQAFDRGALTWGNFAISGTNTTGASTGTVSGVSLASGLIGTVFRSWTLVDNTNPLPIEMLYLSNNCKDGSVIINWATATEVNSSYFRIEKSIDANKFELLGKINAAGNSIIKRTYSFTDTSYESGTVYYRISEIDLNGAETFSEISNVNCDSVQQKETFDIFSFEDEIYLSLNSPSTQSVEIIAYDLSGRQVYTNTIMATKGENKYSFNLPITQGIYVFQVKTIENTYVKKLLVMRK